MSGFRFKSELLSMEEFKDGPLLTREALKQCRGMSFHPQYLRILYANAHLYVRAALLQAPPADPRISPLLFPSHTGVPRTFVTYNGVDPLRDDGRLFARVLREAGVPTKEIL